MKKNLLFLSSLFLLISITLSAQVDIDALKEKLVYYYPLDGDGTDLGPNGVDDALFGDLTTFDEGIYGKAARLEEVGSWIEAPAGLFLYGNPDIAYTFTLWMKVEVDYMGKFEIIQPTNASSSTGHTILLRNEDSMTFEGYAHKVSTTAGDDYPITFEWQHIAVVVNQIDLNTKIYIDGELAVEADIPELQTANDGSIVYGTWKNKDKYQLNGMMDEICLFEDELTEEELAIVMNNFVDPDAVSVATNSISNAKIYTRNNELVVELQDYQSASISIIDLSGRIAFSDTFSDLSYVKALNLNKGMYIVSVENKDGISRQKIQVK